MSRTSTFKRASWILAGLLAWNVLQADEGTSDPDLDYLPPDGIFSRFAAFVTDMFTAPAHAGSYTTAKRRLYSRIADEKTIYCGCTTNPAERTFDKSACGYVPRNDNERARRLEAEHVMPAFWIAKFHTGGSCWVADESCGSARECCLKNDERFTKAHNDLVNLFPSIGELNGDRSNFMYALVEGEDQRNYGACDFEVDGVGRVSEPTDDIRGDLARIYFYMRDTYELAYPEELANLLVDWDAADPISDEERQRNRRIEETQGSSNPLLQN